MKPNLDELGGLYSATLEEYLLRGTEAALHRSYELGRRALTEGLGVLEMIALHQQAMGKILLEMATPEKSVEAVQKGGEFLAEGMSSFEMTHRAFGEANAALRRVNEALEQEAKRIAHTLHDEAGKTEEHTPELQSQAKIKCRLLLEKIKRLDQGVDMAPRTD